MLIENNLRHLHSAFQLKILKLVFFVDEIHSCKWAAERLVCSKNVTKKNCGSSCMLTLCTEANITFQQKALENVRTQCHTGTKYLSIKIAENDL